MRRTLVSLCLLHAAPAMVWAAQPATDSTSLQLDAVNINADASDYERADGPVQGYRATRAASATRTDTALHETPQSVSEIGRAHV